MESRLFCTLTVVIIIAIAVVIVVVVAQSMFSLLTTKGTRFTIISPIINLHTHPSTHTHTHLILPLFQYYISTVYHLSDYQLLYTPIIYYLLHKSLPNCLITCLTRYYSLSLSLFLRSFSLFSFAISSPILPSCKYVYLSSTITVSRCVSVNNFA